MERRVWAITTLAVPALLSAAPAHAQTINTEVFSTIVPFSYDRGHNVSVTTRLRPEYDPIGIRTGGFTVLPSLNVGGGVSDNVYQTSVDKKSDGFVTINPGVRVVSNWSVHNLVLEGNGAFRRYFKETARDEDGWSVGARGRVDVAPDKTLTLAAKTSRLYESQFNGIGLTQVLGARAVNATVFRGIADATFTRFRTTLAADYSIFDYKAVNTPQNTSLSQNDRDRNIGRIAGHVEYGLTPDTGIFVEVGGTSTNYPSLLSNGQQNRDSQEYRVLGGISTDITSLVRGSIGVGYVSRNYDAAIYRDMSGLSIDARIEYFPTDLTTFSISARREIEDSAVIGSGGYWNTGAALRVDHELLRNLILNAGVDYERDTYRGIDGKATILRTGGGADYYMTNVFGLNLRASYARRTSSASQIGPGLSEFRLTAGITIRR